MYSLFLMVLIPALMAANTLVISRSVRADFDAELRRKADLANQVFGASIASNLDDASSMQNVITTIMDARPEVEDVVVVVPNNTKFNVLAASSEDAVGQTINNLQYSLVTDSRQSVASVVDSKSNALNRAWSVTSPVLNADGELVALTSMDVSLDAADALISSTLSRSFFILIGTVILVVLLLTNHFRFVEYALLFRKLKEVDRMKDDFLSVATHELKAPMAIIQGQIDNVIDGVFGNIPDKAKQALRDARGQSLRLGNLVSDLLNVSRIEQGRINYELQEVDQGEVINQIVSEYERKAKEKGLEIEYTALQSGEHILADVGRYQEIMTNLIDNAVKYSLRGKVVISHTLKDGFISTSVRDAGIGMSVEEREKLFQRFYRAQNEKTKKIAGTGLGLWIIKQYIEGMHGKVYVDSLEGVGTEFVVDLPIFISGELSA